MIYTVGIIYLHVCNTTRLNSKELKPKLSKLPILPGRYWWISTSYLRRPRGEVLVWDAGYPVGLPILGI